MSQSRTIYLERAWDEPAHKGSYRVLVDGLWPRGIKKEDLAVDAWYKDIAPSKELRQWFKHDPDKWPEFQKAYKKELAGRREALNEILENAGKRNLTLVFAARDRGHNNAVVVKDYLESL